MADLRNDRPNVIVILTDDQGYWAMGCAGNEEIRTPNLDRLARTGTRFENFFCASPVCSPARASLLTGRIPSQHGVHDWLRAGNRAEDRDGPGRPIEYLAGQTGYSDILAANGYVCGISGKWHLGDSLRPQKGLSWWAVKAGGNYYDASIMRNGELYKEPHYLSDAITNNALAFLEARAGGTSPFYLSVHYTAPHSPWSRKNHPSELWDDYHANCPFTSTPVVPMHPWQAHTAPTGTDEKKRRGILSGYFAAVTAMDANVGRILDWLETHDLRGDTLIFFTSDNGMNIGHHGIYGKGNGTFPMNLYDTSVKVPAIMSRPGHVPEGGVCDNLVSHYDFMPTVLEYVGLGPPPPGLPGRSFAPVLRGEADAGREDVVVCDEYGPVRMVRTSDWKYVHRYPYGPHELYDLVNDPNEQRNLYGVEGQAERIVDLKSRLEAWFVEYVDPALDGTHEAVTGFGQLGLAGPAGHGAGAYATDVSVEGIDPRPLWAYPDFGSA